MRVQGLEFDSYTTGSYQGGKYPGLTLQFSSAAGDYHAIFNVILHYERNTGSHSSGDALPAKEFRVKDKCGVVKFWGKIGLQPPRRKSEYYKALSKLKGLTFAAELANVKTGKLKNSSITAELKEPSGSTSEIISLVADKGQLCGSVGTTLGQLGDNSIGQGLGTKIWDKEIEAGHIKSSSQADSSTCVQECVQNSVRDENTTFKVIGIKSKASEGTSCPKTAEQRIDGLSEYQRLQMQTVEDWLAEYSSEDVKRPDAASPSSTLVPDMESFLELRESIPVDHLLEAADDLEIPLSAEQVIQIEIRASASDTSGRMSESRTIPETVFFTDAEILPPNDDDYADCLEIGIDTNPQGYEEQIIEYQTCDCPAPINLSFLINGKGVS